jgi:hypothetical protein
MSRDYLIRLRDMLGLPGSLKRGDEQQWDGNLVSGS